jgi:shikimate kinase/3-dehydroquinate synthase
VRVALWGPMGAGKTSVGRALAVSLGVPFVDLDAEAGDVEALFREGGEDHFRAHERAALARLSSRDGVIALGGGALVDAGSRELLAAGGWTVFVLSAPLDVLMARVGDGQGRPLATRLPALLRERAGPYARAGTLVHTGDRSPEAVAAELVQRLSGAPSRVDVPVRAEAHAYDVIVTRALAGLGSAIAACVDTRRAVLVANPTVAALHGAGAARSIRAAGFDLACVEVPDGEVHKDVAAWQALVDELLAARVDRRTVVVALGGGVTGDLVGFAAATTLRGLAFVQVPTTLLAMVDSSVGGKVGVNAAQGKNLVGAFHPPTLVYAALDTLATLPDAELRCGLGEVVKHAVIDGELALARLEVLAPALRARDPDALAEVVAHSVQVKRAIVREDPLERGRRALLNAGHTVGHALETALGHGAMRHGEAVALGLLAEARWGARHGAAPAGTDLRLAGDFAARLEGLLRALGLPTSAPACDVGPAVIRDRMLAALGVDKKRERGTLRVAVPIAPGVVLVEHVRDATTLVDCLEEFP